jgi:hypothetical protein
MMDSPTYKDMPFGSGGTTNDENEDYNAGDWHSTSDASNSSNIGDELQNDVDAEALQKDLWRTNKASSNTIPRSQPTSRHSATRTSKGQVSHQSKFIYFLLSKYFFYNKPSVSTKLRCTCNRII